MRLLILKDQSSKIGLAWVHLTLFYLNLHPGEGDDERDHQGALVG